MERGGQHGPVHAVDKLDELARVEVVHALDLVAAGRRDRVAGDEEDVVHVLGAQAEQQRLGGVEVAVATGEVGHDARAELALDLADHKA